MNKRLLIVGENTKDLKLLGMFLVKHSFSVLVATSVKQSIAIVAAKKPDMIISGFLNNEAFLKSIKGKTQLSKIPLILVLESPLNLGVDSVLKPYSLDNLLAKINKHFVKQTTKLEEHATILVVDDIEINRKLVADFLLNEPIRIIKSLGGKDSLNKLKENLIDLILLDIEMPEMNGWQTIKAYKKRGISIPVFALSAHFEDAFLEKCIKNGFEGVITKPIDKTLLLNTLRKYLNNNSTKRTLPQKGILKIELSQRSKKQNFVDLSNLERLTDGDRKLREETVYKFLKNLDTLQHSLSNPKPNYFKSKSFQKELHTFINLSGYFCQPIIIKLAKKLHHQLKSDMPVSVEEITQFSKKANKLKEELMRGNPSLSID